MLRFLRSLHCSALTGLGVVLTIALTLWAPAARAAEKLDLAVLYRIKAEAFQNGKVMDHLFVLTDANGPRLTNSPGYTAAAEWARKTLQGWGAQQPHLERWGPFGRGWAMSRFSLHMTAPVYAPLSGMPRAWTSGTSGPVTGEVVFAPLVERTNKEDFSDLEKYQGHLRRFMATYKGKLRGKIVALTDLRDLDPPREVASTRLDETKLAALGAAPEPSALPAYEWPLMRLPAEPRRRAALLENAPMEVLYDYFQRRRQGQRPLWAFLRDEGVLATLQNDDRGDGGIVFAEAGGPWEPGQPVPPPSLTLEPEAYNRIVRLLQKKVPVRLELELKAQFTEDKTGDGTNVIAELPGSTKKDEVVMLGAHLDSWHTATGATDNGAGAAVMLEAFRILKALGVPMHRTVRLALWGGEEQGVLGSRDYVKQHFGDPITMVLKPEHSKLAAYFNLDNGSGKVRGIYLQGNDMCRPIFEEWLNPLRDYGATTVSIRNTGATDHLPFDAVGLPGFQFIQDPLDYGSRTHHSAIDVYDHAVAADLQQAAAAVAWFVYTAAMRDELLPRKLLPAPMPPRRAPTAQGTSAEPMTSAALTTLAAPALTDVN